MDRRLAASVHRPRLNMILMSLFAALALILAALGVYGVLSYWVSRRTREAGIRLAIGARPRDLVRMVLRQGMALALAGVAVGIAGAWALTRFLSGLLYQVSPLDRTPTSE